MKIVIAGGYDTQNLGDYASFLGLKKILSRAFGEVDFTVLSRHPMDFFATQFPDVSVIRNLDHDCKIASIGRIFNGFNEGDNTEHLRVIYNKLLDSDCLVLGNGRLFVDISLGFMTGPLAYYMLLVVMAKFMGIPVILSSVTLVHPKTELGKEHLSFILSNADLIMVREPSSKEVAMCYVSKHDKIHVCPDVAFALEPSDAINNIDAALPFEFSSNSIGVNFRGVDFDGGMSELTIERIAFQLGRIINEQELNVVFCHQCTYGVDSWKTDDRAVNKRIYDALRPSERDKCIISNDVLSLSQTLGLYSKLSHLLTTRRHGFIMALTQGTPASLICSELNTMVVKESVFSDGLFISSHDELRVPDSINIGFVMAKVEELRSSCTSIYADLFGSILP